MKNKIKKLNVIKKKLCEEFPYIDLIITQQKDKIKLELYYCSLKNSTTNKFNMLDGGIKDRVIRKTKNLIKQYGLDYQISNYHKYIFFLSNKI